MVGVLSAATACVPGGVVAGGGDEGGGARAGWWGEGGDAVEVLDADLAERIESLSERSPTWRSAMAELRRGEFRVVVGDPAGVRAGVEVLSRYRTRHFGEVIPLRDGRGGVTGAVVVVDVERVRRLVERSGLPERVVDGDVERILIHELYGHVVPLARSRRLDGGCPDPGPGEPALSSCAIRRENRIRAELGLEMRVAYDLTGLVVGRYLRGLGRDGVPGPRDDP
ncbi:MAG: hypothetical protein ACODAE_02580 [Gemmatimonadota bacterium]